MTKRRRYTDDEILQLHNEVRELSQALQSVLDELLQRVMAAMEEGQKDYDGAADAIAAIRALGRFDSGGGTSPEGAGAKRGATDGAG